MNEIPANGAWFPIEELGDRPIKIKKRQMIAGEWQEVLFVQVAWSRNLEKWLWEKYPKQGYLKDWWYAGTRVTMHEKVYFYWKLCE
jgi:hypothetical protein